MNKETQNGETQFSIYRISVDRVKNELNTQEKNLSKLLDNLIKYLESSIKKGNDEVYTSKYDIFSLMFIKSTREPKWKSIIKEIFYNANKNNLIEEDIIYNNSSSYILFCQYKRFFVCYDWWKRSTVSK